MENSRLIFDIQQTLDLIEEYSDEEVGKVFRNILEASALDSGNQQGYSDKVADKVSDKGADWGCRELRTLRKALILNAIVDDDSLRTIIKQSANNYQTIIKQSSNNYQTKCEQLSNNHQTIYDERETEQETNKEKEETPLTLPIEEKENNKEKDKEKDDDEAAYAALSEVSNETYDAGAVNNVRARGGKVVNLDLKKFAQHFNKCMLRSNIPKIVSISNRRKSWLVSRVKDYGIVAAYRVIINASRSSFLNGGGNQGFVADFDWMFRPNNFPKILEGQYNDRTHTIITPTANSGIINTGQRQRLEGYAGVAAYWRQQADNDPNALVRQNATPGNISYQPPG